MNGMEYLLVFCFTLIKLISGEQYSEKPCLTVQPVQNLEMDKLIGIWYEVTRYENDFEHHVRCVNGTFVNRDDTYMFTFNGTVNDQLFAFGGPVTIAPNHTGILDFYSSMYKKTEASDDVITSIVAFEANCLVYYYCKYDEDKKRSHDYLWITTKEKSYDGKVKEFVENFLETTPYVNKSRLIWHGITDKTCS